MHYCKRRAPLIKPTTDLPTEPRRKCARAQVSHSLGANETKRNASDRIGRIEQAIERRRIGRTASESQRRKRVASSRVESSRLEALVCNKTYLSLAALTSSSSSSSTKPTTKHNSNSFSSTHTQSTRLRHALGLIESAPAIASVARAHIFAQLNDPIGSFTCSNRYCDSLRATICLTMTPTTEPFGRRRLWRRSRKSDQLAAMSLQPPPPPNRIDVSHCVFGNKVYGFAGGQADKYLFSVAFALRPTELSRRYRFTCARERVRVQSARRRMQFAARVPKANIALQSCPRSSALAI